MQKVVEQLVTVPEAYATVPASDSPQLSTVVADLDGLHARVEGVEKDYAAELI